MRDRFQEGTHANDERTPRLLAPPDGHCGPGRGGLATTANALAQSNSPRTGQASAVLPAYARAQNYRSLKESTYDRTGGNADARPIAPGKTLDVFNQPGTGIITHVWFTSPPQQRIPSQGTRPARLLGRQREAFDRNAGRRFLRPEPGRLCELQDAWIACSPGKSLNSYFAMPYRRVRASPSPTKARAASGRSIPISTSSPSTAPRRRFILPRAVPPGRSERPSTATRKLISTASNNYVYWKRAAAAI